MKYRLWFLLGLGLCLVVSGCRSESEPTADRLPEDSPLPAYQTELLDIAFAAATAMPIEPHIKDRSRIQESVVTACLGLEQPNRALTYTEQIQNWRRGMGYADLALYCVQHGAEGVESYLDLASQVAETTEDWRQDRIRVKVAQTHTWLGRTYEQETFEADLAQSETGKVVKVTAMMCDAESFDELMETLDSYIATGVFDTVKNVLQAYVQLFNQFYQDIDRRSLIEEKIKASWGNMPITIRIDLLMQCARFSLSHEDQAKAVDLVNHAKNMMDEIKWPPRFEIPLRAKLAALRFRAGESDQAHAEIEDALSLFDQQRDRIVNIYRAELLRAIAEAYQDMGDTDQALDVYQRALEAGMENPNSRPRAEDLVATCCSMAVHAVDPGAEVMNRIREIQQGLGDPW